MMPDNIFARTLHFAKILAPIPNMPFLHGPMMQAILVCLEQMGVKSDNNDARYGRLAGDDYGLYVHVRRGQPTHPILVDSHIDHPGFVLDGNGRAIGFGSLGIDRIGQLLQSQPIDLRIFDPAGNFQGLGRLTNLETFAATVEAPFPIAPNSFGAWSVTDLAFDGDNLLMHAADNMIVTDVMLATLERILQDRETFTDIDVTFMFSFLEEVFEVSATATAMKQRTPFSRITPNHLIFVLECMQSVPLSAPLISTASLAHNDLKNLRLAEDDLAYSPEMRNEAINHPLYEALNLPLPNHEDGILIKINDTDGIYGFHFPDQSNMAESLTLQQAEQLGVAYQHTLSGGACNGTAFSLFSTSSHIATLVVPNPYKHNLATNGAIVPECVKIRDVTAVGKVLLNILRVGGKQPIQHHSKSLAQHLKTTSLSPTSSIIRPLRAERGSIAWGMRWRLRQKRYFGANFWEHTAFKVRGGLSRLREQVYRFIK